MKSKKQNNRGRLITIPNLLSFFRLLCAPFVFFFFTIDGFPGRLITLSFLLVAFSTDYFDGFFARKLDQQSDAGRILDPLADKAIVLALMIAVVLFRDVPFYFILIILARDLIILGGGLIIKIKKGIVVESNIWGKAATFILMTAFLCFIFEEISLAASILLFAGMFLILVSLVTYFFLFINLMKKNT